MKNVMYMYFSVSAIQTDREPKAMKTVTGDVRLLDLVLGLPFDQHIRHWLRRESH